MNREAGQRLATIGDLRDEVRTDRQHFQREILRLTAEHAKGAGGGSGCGEKD